MKKNKILSLALALIMALSMAVPAFAVETVEDISEATEVEIESLLNEQIIKITMDTAPGAALNPYALGYTARTSNKTFDPIASKDNLIISTSNVPIEIGVIAKGEPSDQKITLVESASELEEEERQVYMYAVFQALDTSDFKTADTVAAAMGDTDRIYPTNPDTGDQIAIDYADTPVFEEADNGSAVNAVAILATATEEPAVVAKLGQNNVSKTGTGENAVVTPKTLSAVAYKLAGDVVETPSAENGGNWAEDDGVTVSLAFSFYPKKADARQQQIWDVEDKDGGFDINLEEETESAANTFTIALNDTIYTKRPGANKTYYSVLLPEGVTDVAFGTLNTTTNLYETGDIKGKTSGGDAVTVTGVTKAAVRKSASLGYPDGKLVIDEATLVDYATKAKAHTTPQTQLEIPVTISYKQKDTTKTANITVTAVINETAGEAITFASTPIDVENTAGIAAALSAASVTANTSAPKYTLLDIKGDITDLKYFTLGATDGKLTVSDDIVDAEGIDSNTTKYVSLQFSVVDSDGATNTLWAHFAITQASS